MKLNPNDVVGIGAVFVGRPRTISDLDSEPQRGCGSGAGKVFKAADGYVIHI